MSPTFHPSTPAAGPADAPIEALPPLLVPTPARVDVGPGRVGRRPKHEGEVEIALLWMAELSPAAKHGHFQAGPGLELVIAPVADGALEVRMRATADELSRIQIRGVDRQMLFAGLAIVRQLLAQYRTTIPELVITERTPGFVVRGFMLDVSRDRVPTMAHLREIVDTLWLLRFNHLQLYTEHTFAYAGHEDAWSGSSPITPEEMRELDSYARARGIELVPNQNCFGHLASWLKKPRYAHLSEIKGDGAWKFLHWERRGPFSLCPTNPGSIELVRDLLGQITACAQSSLVNIGCDETFDVGFGRSRARVEELGGGDVGRAKLYFEFVQSIARVCADLGKRPMMWADIALSHPELLEHMPAEMIGLAWWYELTDKFARWVEFIRARTGQAWVCPGTSSWRSFTGRTDERRGNIAGAAMQGASAGAQGFLLCDWGDLGHRQQWPLSFVPLAQAAQAAWRPEGGGMDVDLKAASLHLFHDQTLRAAQWMEELGNADRPIRESVGLTNATALFNDLHPPVPAALKPGERAIKAPWELWDQAARRLSDLERSRPAVGDTVVDQELAFTVQLAHLAAEHARFWREAAPSDTERAGLRARFERVLTEHERLWRVRSREGGLERSSAYYREVIRGL